MSAPLLPQTQVSIKDKQYQLTALPASLGTKAVVRLMKFAGPVFSTMLEQQAAVKERNQGKGDDVIKQLASEAGNAAFIRELTFRLSDEDIEYFQGLFFPRTEVMAEHGFVPLSNKQGVGGYFVRDYGAYFLLLIEHLKFNFADFFGDAAQLMA